MYAVNTIAVWTFVWKVVFIIACAWFLGLGIVVTVKGIRDIASMLRDLAKLPPDEE